MSTLPDCYNQKFYLRFTRENLYVLNTRYLLTLVLVLINKYFSSYYDNTFLLLSKRLDETYRCQNYTKLFL